MSVSKYRWTEACEGQPCPGDCDLCSKEPEAKNDDLISRKAAIDAIVEHCGVSKAWAWTYLSSIPSAQPEIIRCKDCKHFEYDHPYIIQGIPVLGHEVCNAWGDGCKTDENGYCFMAERRNDGR